MSYFYKRLLSDKRSCFIFLFFFSLVLLDPFLLYQSFGGYDPNYSTFLAGNSEGHYAQMLVLWLLPIYLIFGTSAWVLADVNSGNVLSVIGRTNRKYYWKVYNQVNFLYGFSLIFIPMILNYVFVTVIFRKETTVPFMIEQSVKLVDFQRFFYDSIFWELSHPELSNILHITMVALTAGCMSVMIATINIFTKSFYYTVFIVISLWYLLISITPSIMILFQPFTEYSIASKMLYFISSVLLLTVCLVIQKKWWLQYDFV